MGVAMASMAIMGAGAAFSAYSSIKAGKQESRAIRQQSEYNAQMYEQQASMITQKQKIQDYQSRRQIAHMRSTMVSQTAGKGLQLSGSPLAVMADTESQMLFDKAIQDYNLKIERNYAMSKAKQTRYAGMQQSRLAKSTGYKNAFSTILNTGSSMAMSHFYGPQRAGKI